MWWISEHHREDGILALIMDVWSSISELNHIVNKRIKQTMKMAFIITITIDGEHPPKRFELDTTQKEITQEDTKKCKKGCRQKLKALD